MNISATRPLSIVHMSRPLKVEQVAQPELNAPSETNIIKQSAIDTANPSLPHSVAPNDKSHRQSINTAQHTEPSSSQTVNDTEPKATAKENYPVQVSHSHGDDVDEHYSESELALISTLQSRDIEISAHERAHSAIGGKYAGSPRYRYETGPDGVKYAISGEVSINTSVVPGDPKATLLKAQQIKAAALAPIEPSAQDIQVVAKAEQIASQARNDILEINRAGYEGASVSYTYDTSIPEHFTEKVNLSSVNDEVKNLMSERNVHINDFYQSSVSISVSSSFKIQV